MFDGEGAGLARNPEICIGFIFAKDGTAFLLADVARYYLLDLRSVPFCPCVNFIALPLSQVIRPPLLDNDTVGHSCVSIGGSGR